MALDKVRSSAAAVMGLVVAAAALLSPPAPGSFNDEVNTLLEIKRALNDPSGVLRAWDPEVIAAGDELCDWPMVVCNVKDQVFRLDLSNQNLSGTLSPAIGNLRSMRNLLLCNNSISGLIPDTIGQIVHLETLDLSNNQFTGSIPSTLGGLAHLQYLELNKNSLSGHIPDSLATASMLSNLDLSFNNLSGPLPIFCASIVSFQGNPLLNPTAQEPHDFPRPKPANSEENSDVLDERDRILDILAVCLSVACVVTTLITGVIVVYRCRHRHEQAGAVDDVSSAISLTDSGLSHSSWSLKLYKFEEMRMVTNNFSQNNILGEGGYGIVYKGCLPDGTIVAVKRLKNHALDTGGDQFLTEVEVISLILHRNLFRLSGFCATNDERLLVYPYMPNGTVASKLQECVNGKPSLDWPMRKRIALDVAHGLLYFHEKCDPKIIHCDIKASNILLDKYLEAIVEDFGLAKLVDHGVSHVVKTIHRTLGHIPPDPLMTSDVFEKTDVFAFGLMFIELVTGGEMLELHETEYQKGRILEWTKELLEPNQLSSFVDKKLRKNYDSAELVEMVHIALLCIMYNTDHCPRMSEILRMLEGEDEVARKWETMKNIEEPGPDSHTHLFSTLD